MTCRQVVGRLPVGFRREFPLPMGISDLLEGGGAGANGRISGRGVGESGSHRRIPVGSSCLRQPDTGRTTDD